MVRRAACGGGTKTEQTNPPWRNEKRADEPMTAIPKLSKRTHRGDRESEQASGLGVGQHPHVMRMKCPEQERRFHNVGLTSSDNCGEISVIQVS